MRRPIIAGNWKMNKTVDEAVQLVKLLKQRLADVDPVEVVVCPPFTALSKVAEVLKDTKIQLGAQNMFYEPEGAYTGEVSAKMLLTTGCRFVILGHSERRIYFEESNETVNKKVKAALASGLTPIVCVGEKLEEREAGIMEEVVEGHVTGALDGLSREDVQKVIIAYEPVWAIGTGRTATPEQANEAHSYIRWLLGEMFDQFLAEAIQIQYGGSVKPENSAQLLSQSDIDGALVGGASLDAELFSQIVKSGV